MKRLFITLLAGLLAGAAFAEPVQWTGLDIAGKSVTVPAKQQVCVIVFFKAQQSRSLEVVQQLKSMLAEKPLQVLAVVSGKDAAAQAQEMVKQTQWPWPVIADQEFALSGAFAVRVWPTTVVVKPDGAVTAHLPGLFNSFAKDLQSHLDFAAGKIDQAQLDAQLGAHEVVGSKTEHIAARHQRVALRLLERHDLAGAQAELEKALEQQPDDAALVELMARVKLLQGEPRQALQWLGKLSAGGSTKAQTTRGRALLALGQQQEAIAALTAALKLNPEPAEAHYALGMAYTQAGDAAKAADHFRAAFEATEEARRIGIDKSH